MDIIDRGSEGIKFSANTANTDNLVRWWIRTVKEAYPDSKPHDEGKYGHNITIPIVKVRYHHTYSTGKISLYL